MKYTTDWMREPQDVEEFKVDENVNERGYEPVWSYNRFNHLQN